MRNALNKEMRILAIVSICFIFISCHSKKKLTDKPIVIDNLPKTDTVVELKGDGINRKSWEYFSSRMGIDYTDDKGEEFSVTVSMRMRKDSVVWFTVSAAMGIQLAKGLITRDSFYLLDLFHREYFKAGIAEFTKNMGASVSLRNLQNIIIGNPVFDTLNYSYSDVYKGWFINETQVGNLVFVNANSNIDSSFVLQNGTKNQLKSLYEGIKTAGSFNVSEVLWLRAFTDKKNVQMRVAFTTASDAYIPSYPFQIPSDYKQKD
jgi:hypothetical protein